MGDAVRGAAPACVFGAGATPAHVISSVLVSCEVSAGVEVTSPELGDAAGGTGAMWGAGTWGDEVNGRAKMSSEVGSGRADGTHAANPISVGGTGTPGSGAAGAAGLRPITVCSSGATCDSTDSSTMLWFQSVASTTPVAGDIQSGWTDGGTLVRVALSAPLPPEWLECRFGSVAVPARPALATSAGEYGASSVRRCNFKLLQTRVESACLQRWKLKHDLTNKLLSRFAFNFKWRPYRWAYAAAGATADMELECITPG